MTHWKPIGSKYAPCGTYFGAGVILTGHPQYVTCPECQKSLEESGYYRYTKHFSRTPYKAVCGADVPNQATTQVIGNVTCVACLLDEVMRLRWRLNHQTDDDAEECRRGLHPADCGKTHRGTP
jgi:hypothetical protein